MSLSHPQDRSASRFPVQSVMFLKLSLKKRLAQLCHLSFLLKDNAIIRSVPQPSSYGDDPFLVLKVKETPREVCTNVDMVKFREVCDQVPRIVPKVQCETRMKEIELKEICLDIDIQLPREECKTEEREECKFEPKEVIVQRCEPTVKEICEPTAKTVCSDRCSEKCEDQDKRVCMTIPQQECKENSVPKCELVSKEECKMVPKEKCIEVTGRIQPGQCRINTRLACEDIPKQKCGKKVIWYRDFNT